MSDRGTSDGATGVIIAVLVLVLLLAVGGGIYLFRQHSAQQQQQMLAMMAQVRMEEVEDVSAQNSSPVHPATIDAKTEIETVLRKQEAAWNSGDIDKFMDHYWKSDDLTFSSGGKTTRGWSATLANYKHRYPTTEQMGQIQFADIEIKSLGDDAALVLGTWRLDRTADPLKGNFSLVFRNVDGRWLISHDHTSRLTE